MLPAQHRLRKKQDIQRVYQNGKKQHHSVVRIVFLNNQQSTTRVAVVVSQRVSKSAVRRNRVKRQLRSIIQDRLLHIKAGYDIVVIAQPQITTKEQVEIAQAVDKLFTQNELYTI